MKIIMWIDIQEKYGMSYEEELKFAGNANRKYEVYATKISRLQKRYLKRNEYSLKFIF